MIGFALRAGSKGKARDPMQPRRNPMTIPDAPRVVWPAPGLPAFISGEQRTLAVLVEHGGSVDSLSGWAARLALRDLTTRTDSVLQITAVREFGSNRSHPYAAEYLRQRSETRPLFEILALVPRELEPQPPRTAAVFHLVRDGVVERPSSVAVMGSAVRGLRVAFATDLHVARIWDAIAVAIDRHAPDLRERFCYPQRLLAVFVAEVNQLAARGQLDLVVLGGDLVDHVYPAARAGAPPAASSKVQLLLDLLATLSVPVLAIPGNHDYRVNPWRPRVFGLGSVGIPRPRLASLLKAAGMWEAWRLRPSDCDALRTHDHEGGDGLLPHLSLLAPATDFHLDIRGTRLVFFASGRDVVLRWRGLDWSRRSLLARALPTSWVDPDSEGPSHAQMRWLSATLAGAHHAAVFFHAPILTPHSITAVEDHLEDIHPGQDDGHDAQVAFERRLQRSGLRRGVSFRNMAPLVRALASVRGSVATFSGHVHRSSRIEVDRDSLRLRSAPIASDRNGADTIPLHIGASLGHVRAPGGEPPGYLLAEFDGGALRQVRRRVLDGRE